MAEFHSPNALQPARRSTAATTPRLRDSCHGCASSKLKCGKEKPTCARCVKRGMVCEYLATRRAGRKTTSRLNNSSTSTTTATAGTASTITTATTTATSNITTSSSSLDSSLASSLASSLSSSSSSMTPSWSTCTGQDLLASPHLTQVPLDDSSSYASDAFLSLLPSTDLSTSTSTTLDTTLDNFFGSPISFSLLEVPDTDGLVESSHHHSCTLPNELDPSHATSLKIPDNVSSAINAVLSERPLFPRPCTPPDSRPPTTSSQQIRRESACCLSRALTILKQLFPNASLACTASMRQGDDRPIIHIPTIQSVLAENGKTIEAITDMLQCSCSEDAYLLAIMSLIIFKVLGWYAAAARATPVTQTNQTWSKPLLDRQSHLSEQVLKSPANTGIYHIEGEDQGRIAAQQVLGELHRVQRSVNQLSDRLKCQGIRNEPSDILKCVPDNSHESDFSQEGAFPFPVTMLDQLAADLPKHLRALSAEIVNTLRQQ